MASISYRITTAPISSSFRRGTLMLLAPSSFARTAVAIAGLALLVAVWPVRAQDDASRALILKAVEAHGGKKTLAKYQAAQVKYSGEFDFMGNKSKMSGEVAFQFPHKMKNT